MTRSTATAIATLSIAGVLALLAAPAYASGGRIALSPDPVSLTRGEVTTFTISLDEPIICIEADPCELVLDLSNDLPEGFAFDPAVVTIDSTEWFQPVTVTASLDVDAPEIDGDEFTISATAVSGSEYYDGFGTSVTFTVTEDNNPAPADDELAATGAPDALAPLGTIALVAVGVAYAVGLRSRQTR